jgi:hypothetical protein
MKVALAYIVLTLCAVTMCISAWNPALMSIWRWDKIHLNNGKWYSKHKSPWGDLTAMAYLDNVAVFREVRDFVYRSSGDTSRGDLSLFVIGDSYTEDITAEAFPTASVYKHCKNTSFFNEKPIAGKTNVVVIEMTERLSRPILRNKDITDSLTTTRTLTIGNDKQSFSGRMNKNIEYLLFEFNFINEMKYAKAEFNYRFFGQTSGDVALSASKDWLFFRPTVLPHGEYSSYSGITNSKVDSMVESINEMQDFFKQRGFDEVYLSIIPSPASILQPNGYNQLIPLIQSHPDLKMKFIDLYTPFRNHPSPRTLYRRGDTHWNNAGMQVWLQLVRKRLTTGAKSAL